MNPLKTYPVFSAIMAAFAALLGAEIWMLVSNQQAERRLEQQVESRVAEIERLQRQRPFPDDANARAAQDDFIQNAEVLATMLRSLNVVGPDELDYFKGEPGDRTAAYFDIAAFVDAMRKAAAEAGVELEPDERFGFSAYAFEGPESDLSRSVYRQRRIVEYLLRALFPAKPKKLGSVQREEPARLQAEPAAAGARPAGQRVPSSASSAGGRDIFVVDPQVSARTPGYVDTMAFRITFTGHTSSLREFVNALAAPDLPLVVRSVEVGASGGDIGRPGSGRSSTSSSRPADPASVSVPIVAENEAQFTVTVEFFEVKIRPPASLKQQAASDEKPSLES